MDIFLNGIPEEQAEILKGLHTVLEGRYRVEIKDHADFEAIQNALMDFESIRRHQWITVLNHFEITDQDRIFHLFYAGLEYTLHHNNPGSLEDGLQTLFTELRLIGYCDLAADAGHTLIRPRSMADFLTEFIGSVEIKTPEAADFNRSYHVISDDKRKALDLVTPAFLESVRDIHGLHIETLDNVMAVFFDRIPIAGDGMTITGILDKLAAGK